MLTRVILSLMLVLFAAGGVSGQEAENRVVAPVDPDGVQRVEVLAGEYYFKPNVIVVKANVPVELQVRTEGGFVPHNFTLKAPEASIDLKEELSSEGKTILFTPTRPGRYSFECSKRFLFFASHKEQGMHGVLEVVE